MIVLSHFDSDVWQSIGYASLAKLDPQYGLCKSSRFTELLVSHHSGAKFGNN